MCGELLDGLSNMPRRSALILSLTLLCWACLPSTSASLRAQPSHQAQWRVLVINSYSEEFPTTPQRLQGLRDGLDDTRHQIELDIEFLDSKALWDDTYQELTYQSLRYKLSHSKAYDLVVVADDNALHLARQHHAGLLGGRPVVFLGINDHSQVDQVDHRAFTGVLEDVDIHRNLELMHRLHPKRTNLYVIVDHTTSGQADYKTLVQLHGENPQGLRLIPLDLRRLSMAELEHKLSTLGEQDVVLLLSAFSDRSGEVFTFENASHRITQASQAPVWHLWEHGLGDGLFGGWVISQYQQGFEAGRYTRRILEGATPIALPVLKGTTHQPIFDQRLLDRFAVPPDRLPGNARLLHQHSSVFDDYALESRLALTLMALLGLAVLALSWLLLRLRRTHLRLQASQHQLQQAARLEALGLLAGGIAHDFNNLLTIIQGTSELLQLTLTPDPQTQQDLEILRGATGRGAALVRRLKLFSDSKQGPRGLLDLGLCLEENAQMLHRLLPTHTRLLVIPPSEPVCVEFEAGQMERIILNLVVNASQAMPQGGDIELQLARQLLKEALPTLTGTLAPGAWARLSVQDQGPGIPREHLASIFDPFFTTRPQEGGTGLGLSIVHELIKQHQGGLLVHSQPQQGTRFEIYLPLSTQTAPSDAAPTQRYHAHCECHVLVVEDEEGLRHYLKRLLEAHNYTVHLAPNGQQAIDTLQSERLRLDLVISDIKMPIMDGAQLGQWLAEHHPRLPVLYISGHATPEQLRSQAIDRYPVLDKPFTARQLLERVYTLTHSSTTPTSGIQAIGLLL